MKPRYYQWESVCAIWDYFLSGKQGNPLVAMPTGTGKSVSIATFVRTVFDKYHNQKIMVLTHVKELIEQNHEKLMTMWPVAPAGIYSSGLNKRDKYNNVIFAGIGSVVNRAAEFGHIDLIIIDEAHLVSQNDTTMYRRFIDAILSYNPHLKIIGFTATPYRLGHGMLTDEGGIFTDICYDLTTLEKFNQLIEEGFLCRLVPKKTKLQLNIDGVRKSGGELVLKDLQKAVDKYELTEAACREAMEAGHDRNCWLVFTTGVEHAIHTAEILNMLGISAKAIHSGNKTYKMSGAERDQAIRESKTGQIRALVNYNVLTTGFDNPRIDLILMLRPTFSPGLWVQMLGRGTRPWYADGYDLEVLEERLEAIRHSQKRDCLVLDFGGNTKRLGPINDPLLPPKKGKKKPGNAPIKLCEAVNKSTNKVCDTWVHAGVKNCPECGNEFVFKMNLMQEASTDELIKADLPVVEEFKVDYITCTEHFKQGRPPSMKVTYHCGLTLFRDFVCFEHEGYARKKAERWWSERSSLPFPESTEQALAVVDRIETCTSLRVWVNKQYPEIMAYCFDGSHFGKEEADPFKLIPITADKRNVPHAPPPDDFEDDIPF